jgi:small subunit ribosomal protein S1
LGDLDALTNLKAQMEDSAREEAKKKLDKKEKTAKVAE